MVAALFEILKIMGLAVAIIFVAGVIIVLMACVIFILKEMAGIWKNGAKRKE